MKRLATMILARPARFLIAVLALVGGLSAVSGAWAQSRVEAARKNRQPGLAARFKEVGVEYPPEEVFIRVFKLEAELELWARAKAQDRFTLIRTWPVCYVPGELGPKRREGDGQVPEGVYRITRFNPFSSYHLSLGLDYPNRSDRILGDPDHPGGDVFIHGECVSIGCIPIRNGPIEELYLAALDSKSRNSRSPAVHVFPCRMDRESCQLRLKGEAEGKPQLARFWLDLEQVYLAFERTKIPPRVDVDSAGRYRVRAPG